MVEPVHEAKEPAPRTRAKSLAVLFGGFATIVSIVIFLTEEDLDVTLAYFTGLHVSDNAEG